MELSEEKKAIEDLKKLRKGIEILNLIAVEKDEVDIIAIDTILDLIEKQQKEIEEKSTIIMAGAEKVKQLEKEIEEMREELQMYVDVQNNDIHNYISKDKIKEKIKEYDKWIKQGEYIESLEAQKYALNELLEEN